MSTPREIVLAHRRGYMDGRLERMRDLPTYDELQDIRYDAARKYPLPKRTAPREMEINDTTYRIVNGRIHWRQNDGEWSPGSSIDVRDAEQARQAAHLFENPNVEVDDDGSAP